jgi:hypothetical protein
VDELGPRERVAVRFAIALFALCAVLSLGLSFYWYQHSPAIPKLSGLEPNDRPLLQQFQTQNEIVFDQVSKVFDLFVVKAFLPTFATIIGYLLGKRESGN